MNALYPNASCDDNAELCKLADFSRLDGRYYNAVLGAYTIGLVGWENLMYALRFYGGTHGETLAALKPGTPNSRAWTESDLTESGKFVFSHFAD